MENKNVIKFQVKRVVYHYEDYEIELNDSEYNQVVECILDDELDEEQLVYLLVDTFDAEVVNEVVSDTDDYKWNPSHGDKYDNTTEFITMVKKIEEDRSMGRG
jgi:hypothetical protein